MCAAAADVAVVGGGVTGLATAWFLRQRAPDLAVTVYEANERLGGKIRTLSWQGVPLEAGPDTFLARVPWAADLCRALGLGDDLVAPATGRAYVWTRGALRALPQGTVLGVPARLGPLARSGIVSPPGLARAALDLVLPGTRWGDDPSVAEVVGGRFGREVVARLVEPLLGGIHAGLAGRLSLHAVAPEVAASARAGRSLMLTLGRQASSPGASCGPVFLSLRGGLQRLVDRLAERLAEAGVDVRPGEAVASLDGLAARATVLALPAHAAAPLVRPVAPAAAADLDGVDYASVVTATLAYPPAAFARPLDGSGFLVPRTEGRLLTACTWLTSKWPELAPAGGRVLLRASAGHVGDDRPMRLDDAAIVEQVRRELAEAMGLRGDPEASLVTRWPRALPQYDVGHLARVARVEAALPPSVVLAGAAYHGVGIAACVHDADRAAGQVLALLR